jgi:uncharacterized protein with von Willebrand factor type A (vWA) domain
MAAAVSVWKAWTPAAEQLQLPALALCRCVEEETPAVICAACYRTWRASRDVPPTWLQSCPGCAGGGDGGGGGGTQQALADTLAEKQQSDIVDPTLGNNGPARARWEGVKRDPRWAQLQELCDGAKDYAEWAAKKVADHLQAGGDKPPDDLLADLIEDLAETRAELDAFCPGLGGKNEEESTGSRNKRLELAQRIHQDPKLRKILDLAGRISSSAWQPRTVPSSSAREDVVDLERGSDLSRVVMSRLSGLRHPLLRKLVLRDFVEHELLQYEMTGWEPVQRGPILLLLDESGSMAENCSALGVDRMALSSAVALGAMRIAQIQRRSIAMAGFSGGLNWSWAPGGLLSQTEYVRQAEALLKRRPWGGTTIDQALDWGAGLAARTQADVVVLTDGEIFPCAAVTRLAAVKQRCGLRVFTLLVGGAKSPVVEQISDESYRIDLLGSAQKFGADIAGL